MSHRRLGIFVCATAIYGATGLLGASWDNPASILSALFVLASAPFSTVRTVIGRSDDVYAAVSLAGGVGLILGFVVLQDGFQARMLAALGVLLTVPGVIGPRRADTLEEASVSDELTLSDAD